MSFYRKAFLLAGASLLLTLSALGGQERQPGESKEVQSLTKLRVEVSGGEKSEPVAEASVYIRYKRDRLLRKSKKVEMNLKTNRAGIAVMPDLPRGTVTIQVVAPGWKPFGQEYDLNEEKQTVKIKLEKPARWY